MYIDHIDHIDRIDHENVGNKRQQSEFLLWERSGSGWWQMVMVIRCTSWIVSGYGYVRGNVGGRLVGVFIGYEV